MDLGMQDMVGYEPKELWFLTPLFWFTNHLEEGELADVDMEKASSMIIYIGWHNDDNGFNVAGLSSKPFQCASLECPS